MRVRTTGAAGSERRFSSTELARFRPDGAVAEILLDRHGRGVSCGRVILRPHLPAGNEPLAPVVERLAAHDGR